MASGLKTVACQAIVATETDMQFESQALKAWRDYQLSGVHVSADDIDSMFDDALKTAQHIVNGLSDGA